MASLTKQQLEEQGWEEISPSTTEPTAEELAAQGWEVVPSAAEEPTAADLAAQGWEPVGVPPGDTPSKSPTSYEESALRGATQGLTMDFADEAAGTIEALWNKAKGDPATFKDLYEKYRDESRANFAAAEKANPKTYLAGQLAGGVAGMAAPGVGWLGTGAKLSTMAAKGALAGAIQGAGATEADLLSKDAALDIGTSAVLGAGFSAAAGGVGKLFSKKGAETLGKEAAEKAVENVSGDLPIPPAIQNDIFDMVEKEVVKSVERDTNFINKLKTGEIETTISPKGLDTQRLLDFSNYIDTGVVGHAGGLSAEEAVQASAKLASQVKRFNEADLLQKYQDFRRIGLANEIGPLEAGLEYGFTKTLRDYTNSFIDFSYAARDIDRRTGSNISESLLRGTSGVNNFQLDLFHSLQKAKSLVEDTVDSKKIVDAIENPALRPTLSEEEKKLMGGWQKFFKEEQEAAVAKGVPIERRGAEMSTYVPHKMVDSYEAIHKIRQELKKFEIAKPGTIERADAASNLTRAMAYLKGEAPDPIKDPAEWMRAAKELTMPKSDIWVKEKIASALFRREDLLPDFLRETDLMRLSRRWAADTWKYANTKDVIQSMRTQKSMLKSAGHEADAQQIDNLINDFLGGGRGLTGAASEMTTAAQVWLLEKAALTTNPRRKAALDWMAHSPDSIKSVYMNIYKNYLGLSPRAVVQNLLGAAFNTVPELGYAYGTKELLKAYAKASKGIVSKGYMSQLEKDGFTAPQYSTALLDAFKRKKTTKPGKVAEKFGNATMFFFEQSEKLNRAMAYELGKNVSRDASSESAKKFLSTMPPKLLKTFNESNPAAREKLVQRYLSDRVLYSYNKLNQSELTRAAGPLLSTFTKYPMAVSGRIIDGFRSQGAKGGAKDFAYVMLAPYAAASILNLGLREAGMSEETESNLFNKPKENSVLGQGLASASPVGAAINVLEGKVFRSPGVEAATSILAGAKEGDTDKLGNAILKTGMTFAPGGARAYWEAGKKIGIWGDED